MIEVEVHDEAAQEVIANQPRGLVPVECLHLVLKLEHRDLQVADLHAIAGGGRDAQRADLCEPTGVVPAHSLRHHGAFEREPGIARIGLVER